MNLTLSDSLSGRPRVQQWTPLITQQFRLRHVYQVICLNLPDLPEGGSYYFTLHLTGMSAPFYSSDKLQHTSPKWPEFDQRLLPNLSVKAIVIRIWRHNPHHSDAIITTWGVNLAGLVYIGNKTSEIQPTYFKSSAVIFNMRCGFFSSHYIINYEAPQNPFISNLNLVSNSEGAKKIYRWTSVQTVKSELRKSYDIDKLRKLRSLEISIKNRKLDVESVCEKIKDKCGSDSLQTESLGDISHNSSPPDNVRYAPQLLTMKSVNKMLEERPTKLQRREMMRIRNEIESSQFKNKLLSQEKDKQSALIRKSKNKLKELVDGNEEKNSNLMESYYKLNKQIEKWKEIRKTVSQQQDSFMNLYSQLYHRRRQLLQELLFIYPIVKVSEKKFTIHGIYLPNSDVLSDCSDVGISVALGYITHILLMCSTFLQVPLRYSMAHYGSRSFITDHVSPILSDRDRDFPLFTKGKDRIQFTYAVYLLNKNIAQLRWLFFMHTPELKATLPNLLSLLEAIEWKEPIPLITCSLGIKNETELNQRFEEMKTAEGKPSDLPKKYNKMYRSCECGPGLSEILAIPEAFMSNQINSESFKNFAVFGNISDQSCSSIVIKEGRTDENTKDCDNNYDSIEQGTDMLDPSINLSDFEQPAVDPTSSINATSSVNGEKQSLGDEEGNEADCLLDHNKKRLLETWMDSECSSTECCSREDLRSIEGEATSKVGNDAIQNIENSPLTVRTDALLNIKSFNLVKSKPNL